MKETRFIMGMPVTVEVIDREAERVALAEIFSYFEYVDATFSTYKSTSEIQLVNAGLLGEAEQSPAMRTVLALAEETKQATGGYFDIRTPSGTYDPSGIVKGWAIQGAARILLDRGYEHFYVNAGGDIQVSGRNKKGRPWAVGIQHPFEAAKIAKTVYLTSEGVATSGTYARGNHIYNPRSFRTLSDGLVSLTVIGPNIYEADRFATAAFAMGKNGIVYIEGLNGFEGYAIYKNGYATMTSGFQKYATPNA